ncbi:MAG: permease-like cell division protein FtsX [Arenicellales bacterium]
MSMKSKHLKKYATDSLSNWLRRHLQVFFYTLGQFAQNSINTLMTILALGIGFSIPVIMFSVVDSVSNLGGQWQERPQITLYLDAGIKDAQIESLKTTLASDERLGEIQFISAEQGLAEFSAQHQFQSALELLDENPLPHVFVVFPINATDTASIAELTTSLGVLEAVASAQYDFEWLQKLSALISFLKRAVVVLASIIAIGLLLLIANTIRLEISARRDEIDITDQLGGSPAFIARPFLYMGFLEGFFGGIMALFISAIVLGLLSAPLSRLGELYGFGYDLPLFRLDIALLLLTLSGLLGWISAKFTVSQHLRTLRPE